MISSKDKKIAYIGLAILIAVGGIVLYGKDRKAGPDESKITTVPLVKGPTTPPPGYNR